MNITPDDWLSEDRLGELADRVTGESHTVESWEWISMAEEVLALRTRLREFEPVVNPDYFVGDPAKGTALDEKTLQAIGELRGFAAAIRRGHARITAEQLDHVLDELIQRSKTSEASSHTTKDDHG